MNFECAAQVRDALFHADQAEPARSAWIETMSVIFHAQDDASRFVSDDDADISRAGVARAVVKRFLHDAIDTSAKLIR